jgi:hemerythrin-like metal-binding protein
MSLAPASGLHNLSEFSLKQLVAWGDHLKVHQPQIDAQHEAIFNLALEIAHIWQDRGDLDELKALAEKLDKVLQAHFRYEEQLLAEIGYPELAAHKAEHQVMLHELEASSTASTNRNPGVRWRTRTGLSELRAWPHGRAHLQQRHGLLPVCPQGSER